MGTRQGCHSYDYFAKHINPTIKAQRNFTPLQTVPLRKAETNTIEETATGSLPAEEPPFDFIISALSEMKNNIKKVQFDQHIMAGQSALRESVKYIYSVISPKNVKQSPLDAPFTLSRSGDARICAGTPKEVIPTTPRRPASAITRMFISSTEKDRYLLGGVDGLERDVADYNTAVRKVASKPDAMGRTLCSILVWKEFSDDKLARMNLTGKTRHRDNKKFIYIPKLDPNIVQAIFR